MGQLIGQPSQKAGFVRPLLGGLRQVRVLRTRMFRSKATDIPSSALPSSYAAMTSA